MKELKYVVGANFGDEGKGLMTDYFCHQAISKGKKVLGILPNGGAQRGHTVVTPDGKRHVFHHMSSGTFAGADTYFGANFILNPMVFMQEYYELNPNTKFFADGLCKVSTPYDMLYNQAVEIARGNNRHGSCGLGIFETIDRYKNTTYTTYYEDFICPSIGFTKGIKEYLSLVKKYYEEKCEKQLGKNISDIFDVWNSDGLINHYVNDFEQMINIVKVNSSCNFEQCFDQYDVGVVELGQGLLLDSENHDYFPNLTPSRTTFHGNTQYLLPLHSNDGELEICYVTRTYLTRHGNGRLDNECSKEELSDKIEDKTNIPNEFQGSLRFAPLDVDSLIDRINEDFHFLYLSRARKTLAITHCDQLSIWENMDKILDNFDQVYTSLGETRKNIK